MESNNLKNAPRFSAFLKKNVDKGGYFETFYFVLWSS